jgi:hypothetical protein
MKLCTDATTFLSYIVMNFACNYFFKLHSYEFCMQLLLKARYENSLPGTNKLGRNRPLVSMYISTRGCHACQDCLKTNRIQAQRTSRYSNLNYMGTIIEYN